MREVPEVMHPSYIVPTLQAFESSVMIWGCFNWTGLGTATLFSNTIMSGLLHQPGYPDGPGII